MAETYRGVHTALKRKRGRAADYSCDLCLAPAATWAYDGLDPDERVGPVGYKDYEAPFSTKLNHYRPLCRPCHQKETRHANSEKTHCPKGHEYTPDNLYTWTPPKGKTKRYCRRCALDLQKKKRERLREE